MVLVGADITRLRGLGSSMRVQSEYLSDIVTQVDHWLANESTAAQTRFEKDVERQTKRAKMTTSALIAEILHIEIDPLPKLEDYPPPEADVVHIPNGVDYIIPNDNYESSLDFDGPYAKAVEQWNAKNYDRIEKAAKEAGLDHPSLDNILSNYEPTPYVDNKKPR